MPRRHESSPSPPRRRHREAPRDRSRSPRQRRHRDESPFEKRRDDTRRKRETEPGPPPPLQSEEEPPLAPVVEKETVNYEKSGLLAQASNQYKGITLKYAEPSEARVSVQQKWRLYIFKGDTMLEMKPVSQQSAYMFGREREVVDIATDHPSCSKQHAVLQYREIMQPPDLTKPARGAHGKDAFRHTSIIRPYLIDLDSANGTFINGEKIKRARYYELRHKDVITLGHSTREYILLKEEETDDVK